MSVPEEALSVAIAQHRAGDHAAAERGYREHLNRMPGDPSALHFLGLLRNHQGRNREAIVLMLKALESDPHYVDAWSNLGIAFYEERDLERAEKCCRRALELAPTMRSVAVPYGRLLYRLNRIAEAMEFYRRWSAASPQDPIPQHMLAANGGAAQPARASDDFVRATFDDFAESFDRSLEYLKYRAPQLLCDALTAC